MTEQMRALKIGRVARSAGVSVDTVRFYKRRGVLPAPEREPSGWRRYSHATVVRIRVVRSLQALGLTLEEVAQALSLSHARHCTVCDGRIAATSPAHADQPGSPTIVVT